MSRTTVCAVMAFAPAGGNLVQQPALADETEQVLAKRLGNPAAALISAPSQLNDHRGLGPVDDGEQWQLDIQPVISFSLNKDWNLISQTIGPLIHQREIFPGAGSQAGIGDVLQSPPLAAGLDLGREARTAATDGQR